MDTIVRKKKWNEEKILSILFLGPAVLLIVCMTLIPILIAVNTSFHATEYAEIKEFVGLKYYIEILGSEKGWNSIFNSISYVLMSLVLVLPLGVMSAVLLNRKIKGRTVIRTLIIIPWVLSQTVTALLFKWLLNSNYGPVSYLWYILTGEKIDFQQCFSCKIYRCPGKCLEFISNCFDFGSGCITGDFTGYL